MKIETERRFQSLILYDEFEAELISSDSKNDFRTSEKIATDFSVKCDVIFRFVLQKWFHNLYFSK